MEIDELQSFKGAKWHDTHYVLNMQAEKEESEEDDSQRHSLSK